MKIRIAAVATAAAVILGLTACNVGADPTKGMGDAGVGYTTVP